MIIEFYGLPGTGKTTMASYLAENREDYNIIPEGKEIKKKTLLGNALSYDFLRFLVMAWRLYNHKQRKDKTDERTLRFMLRTYLKYKAIEDLKSIYLNDHGIIQCIASLIWMEEDLINEAEKILEYSMRHLSNKVSFLYLSNTDLRSILERNTDRGLERRLLHLGEEEQRKLLVIQSILFQKTYDMSMSLHCGFLINTNKSIESNASIICEEYL